MNLRPYHCRISGSQSEGYKIAVSGDGQRYAEITLDDLKKMPAVEVVAVNQCSATGAAFRNRMSKA